MNTEQEEHTVTTDLQPTHGLMGERGALMPVEWTSPGAARGRAAELVSRYRAQRREIAKNPHLDQEWAREAVRAPGLLDAVTELLGPDVAVENTFLVIKWPGRPFVVPWHQDGTGKNVELDPARSVAAWLALTDAANDSGGLLIIPGSHQGGYLPVAKEPETGASRGRADTSQGVTGAERAVPLRVRAGSAVLMDSRLVHCSGSNRSAGARVALNIRYVAPGAIVRRNPQSPSLTPVSGSGW
ncbi:phytanoyl-CoA dioxygenase family protein [Streptacidiphilus jiangxiensis]|uniref:Phytanoyl-CoA dioxygenase (PhyH) n=1 Tax=Streptacidiphilus jiangxiensis TaxID=235985 RepID=A0A1H8AIZ4_STRJI|nr:phytanoyl-CoA dioxygenase family protein [Streptacidiphilus jiangxiensis]SEM69798.1 Phytanoyl-CoA dioxygenase (PhyH) [Streptacidiphilus jiangxiensis]